MLPSGPDLFNLPPHASLADIKAAYRRAALIHHPDQNPDPSASYRFRALHETYRRLVNQARTREKPSARHRPPEERLGFLLMDIEALLRKGPAERWTKIVDGLPTVVWVIGALEAVAQTRPDIPFPPVEGNVEGLVHAVAWWKAQPALWEPWPASTLRAAHLAFSSAETRLRALDRPHRRSH